MFWHWIRRQYRKIGRPIPIPKSTKVYGRLTFAYFILAWSIAGYCFFHYTRSGKARPHISEAQYYGSLLGIEKMNVINMKGFSVVSKEEFKLETELSRQAEIQKKAEEEFFGESDPEAIQC